MEDVNAFLAKVPVAERAELERIRKLVKKLVPDAVESISYAMPAFKYKAKPLVYYSAFKDHLSLFPTSGPTDILAAKLEGFKVSKGTIQFTLDKPLPEELLGDIVLTRKAQIDGTVG